MANRTTAFEPIEPKDPANPTLGESVLSTAWLFAETKRIFGLSEPTIMDIFRTNLMFMQTNEPSVPAITPPTAEATNDE